MSSGNNNKGTCITHKTAKSDCFKNSTIRCVAAGCILRFMRGLGQQPQQERLWWITRGIACWYNAYVSSVPVQLLTMYGRG